MMQNRPTLRPSRQEIVRPGASWGVVSGPIRPGTPQGATLAFDRGDPPLRAVSPRSPERTGCDSTPQTLGRRVVAAAPYYLDGTGNSNCRAPARIVDAAQFWLSSFHERYRGASDSVLDSDIERCQAFLSGSGPFIPPKKAEEDDLKGKDFRKGTAITHGYVALLATCEPQGLLDGAPIDVAGSLSWENQREFHHIFPKGYLATCSDKDREHQSEIANIMLLPSGPNKQLSSERPSVYMARLRDTHGRDRFDDILASNLIPPLEDSGLLLDDFEYFLAARLEMIVGKINELAVPPALGDSNITV